MIRKEALHILILWDKSPAFISEVLNSFLKKRTLSAQDRALLQEIIYGVIRWRTLLDLWILKLTKRGPKSIQKPLLYALRIGLYQLHFLQRIPDHAAINTTVDLISSKKQRGFVNAVLRRFQRESFPEPKPEEGLPGWIREHFKKEFSKGEAQEIFEYCQSIPKTFARLNTFKGTQEDLLQAWDKEGVEYQVCEDHPDSFELASVAGITRWDSFKQGLFTIQDRYSASVVQHLHIQKDHTVLDVCAAPGGKAIQMGALLNSLTQLTALDLSEKRLEIMRENMYRLGAEEIELVCEDACKWTTDKRFDRILLDAPCSNLGVLARRVDARHRLKPSDIAALVQQQRELLTAMIPLLKPGGQVLYSTCTLSKKENEENIAWFLEENESFQRGKSSCHIPGQGGDGGFWARIIPS